MPQKLAIAISGAVSLGSYEAGVMFEVIKAIGEHNEKASNEDEKIIIDVITGASAGGMTAAILAQKLLYEGDKLIDAHDNDLYNPWVRDIDIDKLLETGPNDRPDTSILSSDAISNLAQKYFLDRYEKENPRDRIPHPASASTIKIGLSMSNLNGIDYWIPAFNDSDLLSPKAQFAYRRHQDTKTKVVGQEDDNAEVWGEIAIAARACGAFPYAFRALDVSRNHAIEEIDYPGEIAGWNPNPKSFTYSDGGIFNNYPLGMAVKLAKTIDEEPTDYENRFYLYVSPDEKTAGQDSGISETTADYKNTTKALIGSIFKQAGFQDWMMSGRINDSVKRFDDRSYELLDRVSKMTNHELESLNEATETLLDTIYSEKDDDRIIDFTRLKNQFAADKATKTLLQDKGESHVNAWTRAIQVLERSEGISDRNLITLYTITASNDELAGEGIFAFAGFLDERFRKYDYTSGRIKARRFLKALQQRVKPATGTQHINIRHYNANTPPLEHEEPLGDAGMDDIDYKVRRRLFERAMGRIELILKQFNLNWALRKAIKNFVVRPKLFKHLRL